LLLALSISALGWGEYASQRSLATFHELHQDVPRLAPPLLTPGDTAPGIEPVTREIGDDTALAVLRIPRIALEVPVNAGTGTRVLLRGAGLIPGTAAPGTTGNVAIAAHRDSFFRGLKDVEIGDLVELDTQYRTWTYLVTALWVVDPDDVQVIADTGEPVLTLVTCYPFYFVGHAPQRFVVRATAYEHL
jgi:LPXTG-site transpeptidase (sortase) family protein